MAVRRDTSGTEVESSWVGRDKARFFGPQRDIPSAFSLRSPFLLPGSVLAPVGSRLRRHTGVEGLLLLDGVLPTAVYSPVADPTLFRVSILSAISTLATLKGRNVYGLAEKLQKPTPRSAANETC